jgi:hypothetical protein
MWNDHCVMYSCLLPSVCTLLFFLICTVYAFLNGVAEVLPLLLLRIAATAAATTTAATAATTATATVAAAAAVAATAAAGFFVTAAMLLLLLIATTIAVTVAMSNSLTVPQSVLLMPPLQSDPPRPTPATDCMT